jgi:hypothetical protein
MPSDASASALPDYAPILRSALGTALYDQRFYSQARQVADTAKELDC